VRDVTHGKVWLAQPRERGPAYTATRALDVRNRLALLPSLVVVAALLTGCAGPAASPDPYDELATSTKTTWDPIQVNVGVKVTAAGTTVTLDPKDIAIVVDAAAMTFAFHMSLPAVGLGIPPAALDQIGIAGDSLDFDVIYAGDALYARSGVLKPMLRLILGPTGKVPAGDLTGWLKLGTTDELAALSALSQKGGGMPSVAPGSTGTSKASLEAAGVTLTTAPAEKHNGVDAQHIRIAVDIDKLTSNPAFLAGAGPQSGPTLAVLRTLAISGDLWLDPATNRILEADGHAVSTDDPTAVGDVTITAHDPDGTVPLDVPASSVDVPLGTLMTELMKLVGKGAES